MAKRDQQCVWMNEWMFNPKSTLRHQMSFCDWRKDTLMGTWWCWTSRARTFAWRQPNPPLICNPFNNDITRCFDRRKPTTPWDWNLGRESRWFNIFPFKSRHLRDWRIHLVLLLHAPTINAPFIISKAFQTSSKYDLPMRVMQSVLVVSFWLPTFEFCDSRFDDWYGGSYTASILFYFILFSFFFGRFNEGKKDEYFQNFNMI